MAHAFTAEETIHRPAETVWQTLTDWQSAPRWMKSIDRMHAEGPPAAGTALRFESRGKTHDARITACDPGHSLTLTSEQGAVRADYVYRVEPVDADACRMTLAVACTVRGPLRLFAPLLRRAIKWADGGQLAAFKAVVEGE